MTRSFTFDNGKTQVQNSLSARMLVQAEAQSGSKAGEGGGSSAPKALAESPKPTAAPAPASAPRPIEGSASSSKPAPAAVASIVPTQKPRNVAARTLDSQQLNHPDPHLPDIVRAQRRGTGDARFTAKVCVNNDGRVYQVNVLSGIPGADDAIVGTIRQWTYRPQPVSVCFIQNLIYDLQQ
jgi:hypothetical protein